MSRTRRWGAGVASLVLVAVIWAPGAAGATTDPTDEGLWYYTATSVPTVHEITRGAGITIAVIDGPVNPDVPDLAGANLVIRPQGFCGREDGTFTSGTSTRKDAEHATGIVSLLVGNGVGVGGQRGVIGIAPEATVLSYNFRPDNFSNDGGNEGCVLDGYDLWPDHLAVEQAIADGADIISMSFGSPMCEDAMVEAILHAHQAGVIVVTSTDNDVSAGLACPASANGVIVTEIIDANYDLVDPSIEDPYLTILAPGADIRGLSWSDGAWNQYGTTTGSSVAAPFVAGALALAWSVHPDATANQMIQAMLRNTNGEADHRLARNDQYGFGSISVMTMVQSDPTSYPDENPLLHPIGDGARPATEDILGIAPTAEPTPTTTPTPKPTTQPSTAPTPDQGDGLPVGLLIGAGVLLLLALITVVIITTRRTSRTRQSDHPPVEGNHP